MLLLGSRTSPSSYSHVNSLPQNLIGITGNILLLVITGWRIADFVSQIKYCEEFACDILCLLKMHLCAFNFKCVYVEESMQQDTVKQTFSKKDIKNSSLDILHIFYDVV